MLCINMRGMDRDHYNDCVYLLFTTKKEAMILAGYLAMYCFHLFHPDQLLTGR